jgi:hypothetical protein
MVKLFPEQIEPLFTEITGMASTVTVAMAVLVEAQPPDPVPVTE